VCGEGPNLVLSSHHRDALLSGLQGVCRAAGRQGQAQEGDYRCGVMRKLTHVIYGVLKHQTHYDPARVCGSFTATT